MTDTKTELLGTGAALFLIGVFGLVSPIASTTLGAIMQRDPSSIQLLFIALVAMGGILFAFGIQHKKSR